MALLTLRTLTRPGDTTKNAPLTNAEVDTNFINLDADIGTRAPLESPTLTGAPTAPTPTAGDVSTRIATTSFVDTKITGYVPNYVAGYVTGSVPDLVDGALQNFAAQEVVGFTGVGAIDVPSGTTAERPASANSGYFRYNTTTMKFEGYSGSAWGSIGGGATGSGNDEVFWENAQTVTSNYTITAGKNAGTFGPVTVAGGVVVTVPVGSVWTIV